MILVKKLKFFHLLCLSKIYRERLFGDVLDKINPLKTIKTSVYQKRKIRIFSNGLVHGFVQKLKISLTFFLCKIDQEKVFGNVVVRKKFL